MWGGGCFSRDGDKDERLESAEPGTQSLSVGPAVPVVVVVVTLVQQPDGAGGEGGAAPEDFL